MIFRLHIIYNKRELMKLAIKTEKNRKYYRKCLNNFAADCSCCIKSGLNLGALRVIQLTWKASCLLRNFSMF